MEKVWLKNYPPDVPSEINPDHYHSLVELFEESFTKYKEKIAFVNMGQAISYGDLDRDSKKFAAFLQTELKLVQGEKLALMMPNVLQYPICLIGALRAGLTVVNVNPLYTERELSFQLSNATASTIVVLANFAHMVQKVLDKTLIKHIIVTQLGDMMSTPKAMLINGVVKYIKHMVPDWNIKNAYYFRTIMRSPKNNIFTRPVINPQDIAFLQYTGGTTGRSKGAMLTHRNMVANLEQSAAWIAHTLEEGTSIVITALPLYHIYSLTVNCLTFMKIGAKNILITNPKDIAGFVKTLEGIPFTMITGVNTLFNALLQHPKFKKLDFSKLVFGLGGGMAIHKAVAERWKAVTKVPLLEGYGLTECSPAVCMNPLNLKEYSGNIGFPLPSTEVSIRDENDIELKFNMPGELCIRGPQVMAGYWNNIEETKAILTEDGWLLTGDIAIIDELGHVKIVDRKKDMIIISGFNVYPNEIEDIIALMPQVREVAVVGVPHEILGEQIKACIVKSDGALTEKMVLEHCRTLLTGYKIPKIIEFFPSLPKSNIGKILRKELKNKSS